MWAILNPVSWWKNENPRGEICCVLTVTQLGLSSLHLSPASEALPWGLSLAGADGTGHQPGITGFFLQLVFQEES